MLKLLLRSALLLAPALAVLLAFFPYAKAQAGGIDILSQKEEATYVQLFPAEGPADYPLEGERIGKLTIKSAGIEAEVMEEEDAPAAARTQTAGQAAAGTDGSDGTGDPATTQAIPAIHPADTALPGEGGRVVIDGCGNLLFETLNVVQIGDEVLLQTYYGSYGYQVEESFSFHVNETAQLEVEAVDGEMLFIYTDSIYGDEEAASEGTRYGILCTLTDGEEAQWK